MSDTQQAPDWWQASDGKWYPPQPVALPPPPPGAVYQQPVAVQPVQPIVPNKSGKGCLVVALIVLLLFGVAAVGAVATIAYFGNKAEDKLENLGEAFENQAVDPSDPDALEEDQVVGMGDDVELSGYTTTVERTRIDDEDGPSGPTSYLVAEVSVHNRDGTPQPYSQTDWRLQTPDGLMLDATFASSTPDKLGAGQLLGDADVRGTVVWEIGDVSGDFFIIYKPDPFDAARGIWQVSVE